MKISPSWLREFLDLRVDERQLAEDLTLAGIAVEGISVSGAETVFEMEITTNRPDAMNHYGVARECSALYDLALKPLTGIDEGQNLSPQGTQGGTGGKPAAFAPAFKIEIADKAGCARYTSRVLRDVTIKASPESISQRLLSVDQRPINNAADATNYTLWEMGHPTHVFDLDLLEGGKIIVRRAFSGETLKTLDGVERKLTPEDLVIADARKPVALAGVMGGADTMITERTKNILIEAAWFDPVTVRKTAKRHGLHTDASHRFERGADFGATTTACARVAMRILESAGGRLDGGEIDAVARHLDQAPVELRLSEVYRILGSDLEANEVVRILRRLGFELLPEATERHEFTVHIPSWRLDVEREIDLIEEIARLHGYDKFANTLPAFSGAVVEQPDAAKSEKLRSTLLALGYNEAISSTFISHTEAEQFSSIPVLELANPLSEEASVMRTSMVPGMLAMLAYNLNRGSGDVRLFEAGNVFERVGTKAGELKRVCMGVTGNTGSSGVNQAVRPVSFLDLKGDVESLLRAFEYRSVYYDDLTSEYFDHARSARIVLDGATVGQFGLIHAQTAAARKLRQDVFVAELYLDRLLRHGLRQARYEALARYPAVERDFSFVFDDAVVFERIRHAVFEAKLAELRSLAPVEIFRGGSIAAGKYSVLLRVTFQSVERTLREEEIAQWSAQVIAALEKLGGKLRG